MEWGPRRLRQLGYDPVEGCACTRHALLKKRRDPWHRERAAAPIYNRATGTAFRMPSEQKKSQRPAGTCGATTVRVTGDGL